MRVIRRMLVRENYYHNQFPMNYQINLIHVSSNYI